MDRGKDMISARHPHRHPCARARLWPALRLIPTLVLSLGVSASPRAAEPPATYGPPPQAPVAAALNEGPVAPPVLSEPAAPDDRVLLTGNGPAVAPDPDRDPRCRVGGAMDMGIAAGRGGVERGLGATLTYGQDGDPRRPCDDSHVGFAVSVSRSWGGLDRGDEGQPNPRGRATGGTGSTGSANGGPF